MTKYILHGGVTSREHPSNDAFFKEIVKGLKDGAKVLIVYFAIEPDRHESCFAQETGFFNKAVSGVNLNLVLAEEDKFLEQIKEADAVYIRGGSTERMEKIINKFPEFVNVIQGKVVAGSSAGAYILASYYYSNRRGGVFPGLGILPVKIFAHYDGQEDIVARLEETGEDLPVVTLPECEFKVIDK